MALSSAEKNVFEEKGIIHLKRFASLKSVNEVKNSINAELDRLKLSGKGSPATAKLRSMPFFQQITSLSQMVKVGPEFGKLFSEELIQTMNELADTRLKPSTPYPQLLLSLPQKENWTIRNLNWHLDLEVPKKNEIPGVQAFILIDDVKPKGGATLALAGSHKLHYVEAAKNGNAHTVLRQDKVFGKLFNSDKISEEDLLKPHRVSGIEVSILEMAGQAGDVFLMDLRVLHSPSLNVSKNFRMMATNRFIK
jgi:hypothetical protein